MFFQLFIAVGAAETAAQRTRGGTVSSTSRTSSIGVALWLPWWPTLKKFVGRQASTQDGDLGLRVQLIRPSS